jgi:ABC-type microcin C transport system permease subunit YejE
MKYLLILLALSSCCPRKAVAPDKPVLIYDTGRIVKYHEITYYNNQFQCTLYTKTIDCNYNEEITSIKIDTFNQNDVKVY